MGQKCKVGVHHFLQYAGQAKEHPKIEKAGKQKPASSIHCLLRIPEIKTSKKKLKP